MRSRLSNQRVAAWVTIPINIPAYLAKRSDCATLWAGLKWLTGNVGCPGPISTVKNDWQVPRIFIRCGTKLSYLLHFTVLPAIPCAAKFYEIWHTTSTHRRNHVCQIISQSIQGLQSTNTPNCHLISYKTFNWCTILSNNLLHNIWSIQDTQLWSELL